VVEDVAWTENKTQLGRTVEVMFAEGEGRKDAATARLSGRARDNRLVHVAIPDDPELRPRPGDVADTTITYAAPHHLTADAGITNLRRTRGGDAWAARQSGGETGRGERGGNVVGLGMPAIGVPGPV
jgi:tRNA-2-methylthio-N6-dimethylallyladenosine synthase